MVIAAGNDLTLNAGQNTYTETDSARASANKTANEPKEKGRISGLFRITH